MDNDIGRKIQELIKENNLSDEDLFVVLKHLHAKEQDRENRKIRELVRSHTDLVGKCFVYMMGEERSIFPPMKKHIKVISARSTNEFRVECLVFEEHPTYWFDYQAHVDAKPGDFFLGHFKFQSIMVESILAETIAGMDEESEEDFDSALMGYAEELKDMQWFCDNYRHGGKLPSDKDWPQLEK